MYCPPLPSHVKGIVAIAGPMTAGKSTFISYLSWVASINHHASFSRHFAKPVREVCQVIFGPSDFESQEGKAMERPDISRWIPKIDTNRRAMQHTGQGLRDAISPWIWIMVADREIRQHAAIQNLSPSIYLFDDLRYDDEADWIRSLGGIVVELRREGIDYTRDHPSECGIAHPDMTFELDKPQDLAHIIWSECTGRMDRFGDRSQV